MRIAAKKRMGEAAADLALESGVSNVVMRGARLEGAEALALYAARADRNLATLIEQVDRLRAAFDERRSLLREILATAAGDDVDHEL